MAATLQSPARSAPIALAIARAPGIVVIMVTALHEVADYERAVESGTDDFLSKPVNKLELLTRARSLLRVALLRRRLDELGGADGA